LDEGFFVSSSEKPEVEMKTNSTNPIYNPSEIEGKWQEKWEQDGLYHADIDYSKPKYYALTMLPYPSGDLHIGHWFAMSPPDARARFKRMQGYNVLFPMGFDAFGLPAENAAIKHNIHPKVWTYRNIETMRKQFRTLGAMFDWRREMISSDPEYYRWTQWFFTQLYKNGLAYRKLSMVDWCPHATPPWLGSRSGVRTGTVSVAAHRSSRKILNNGFSKPRNTLMTAEFRGNRLAGTGAHAADQLDRDAPKGRRLFSPPKTATQSKCSPPGLTPLWARLLWFWLLNTPW